MLEKIDNQNYSYIPGHLQTITSLKTILTTINKEKIPTIVLKGIYLASKVYKDLGRQPGSDIDLLINIDDVLKVKNILNNIGWHENTDILKDLLKFYKKSGLNSIMFFHQEQIPVHLHWHIINSTWPLTRYTKTIDPVSLWENAIQEEIDTVPFKVLSHEHQIIYLCIHAFTHYFDKPVYIKDIQTTIDSFQDKVDWEYLYKQAKEWEVGWLVDHAINQIKQPTKNSYFSCYRKYLIHEENILKQTIFILQTIFPPKIIIAQNLGIPQSKVTPIHYLSRIMI